MKKILLLAMICLCFAGLACTKKNSKEVNVFNWSEYIPNEVLNQFEKETGIKVNYTTYDSNEAMYAKIKVLDGAGYDVIVPSTYYVDKLSKEGLLQKLDHAKLPNFSGFNPKLLHQNFDPENNYSIPFMWGTTAIGVNAKYINPDNVTSWKDLWNPAYKGKVMLQNDVREVFHVALHLLGFSGNTDNETQIKAAYEELQKLMPSVRLLNSDSPKVPFLNEEVNIGLMWSGEAFMANNENPNIKYIYPVEGAAIWADNFAIPSKAKNVENAYAFIDFISRPDISAKISNELGYSSPVLKAADYLDNETKNSSIVYPSDKQLENAEFQIDVGPAITIYEKYWEKLRANKN